jgi:glycogen debranching enzyme
MDYHVIKVNDLFLLTDEKGNIPENHYYGLGLYTKDTRFLSKFDLKIFGEEPVLLSSEAEQNYETSILLTNPHIENNGELQLWRESVEIKRHRFIYNGVLYESITLKNYYPQPVSIDFSLHVDADFSDMFIVRGFQNGQTGQKTGITKSNKTLTFHYLGADHVERSTHIDWDADAKTVTNNGDITFDVDLNHAEEKTITVQIAPTVGDLEPKTINKTEALQALQTSFENWRDQTTAVETDHKPSQRLIDRGIADLRVLLTDVGYGSFPVAGLPWFGVPFGRDSLIAALQMLPFNPEVAKGTLKTMAAFQGKKIDPWRDEQPGKIMHEMRFGELANTNQIPFTPYYGTIDATPLFLILLSEYIKWSGDLVLFEQLRENIEAALQWINDYGDRDGDGFLEYHQESAKGIANQGWKDSGDSIVHRNGEYAETPVALSEVQGYVYQAKTSLSDIFERLCEPEKANVLRNEAQKLKQQFERDFWMEEHNFLAIALDKNKKQIGTITSNPGHVLLSGMIDESKASSVIKTLMSQKMFSGYGIRTMGEDEAAFNPISYHNGSVWPHDNSLIILGMSKLGHQAEAKKVMEGLIDASAAFEYDRLPELFCGYNHRPVKYPVACSPQAWAAGTPLTFVQALLGLFPNSLEKKVRISPSLLNDMNVIKVRGLAIGEGELDVTVYRDQGNSRITIEKNTTGFEIELEEKVKISS